MATAAIAPLSKKPPVKAVATVPNSMILNLVLEDPEVVAELERRPDGHARTTFAVPENFYHKLGALF